MQITYKFKDLNDIADWLDNKATIIASREYSTVKEERFAFGQVDAYADIATSLRNSEIGG